MLLTVLGITVVIFVSIRLIIEELTLFSFFPCGIINSWLSKESIIKE
jgi:hypothetical protein